MRYTTGASCDYTIRDTVTGAGLSRLACIEELNRKERQKLHLITELQRRIAPAGCSAVQAEASWRLITDLLADPPDAEGETPQ